MTSVSLSNTQDKTKKKDKRERRAYMAQYYQEHRDERLSDEKKKRADNLEQFRDKDRTYYWRHREEVIAKRKKHYRLCKKDILAGQRKRYYENHEETLAKRRPSSRKTYQKHRKAVFDHYGHKCRCCGETIEAFLTIEHINGGGRKHRQEIKRNIYRWLCENNFPTGFKTLCMNCNHALGLFGFCPHKTRRELIGVRTKTRLSGIRHTYRNDEWVILP